MSTTAAATTTAATTTIATTTDDEDDVDSDVRDYDHDADDNNDYNCDDNYDRAMCLKSFYFAQCPNFIFFKKRKTGVTDSRKGDRLSEWTQHLQ